MKPKNQQTSDDEMQLIETAAPTPKPVAPQEEKLPEEQEAELIAEHSGIIY